MTPLLVLPHWWTVDAVEAAGWEVIAHGVAHDAHGDLPGWDYQTPIELRCLVRVDLPRVRRDCGLADDAEVRLVGSWYASSTNRRQVGASVPITESGEHRLHLRVDPTVIGGQLRVTRQLVLGRTQPGTDASAPRRAGSILWYEPHELITVVHLEGDAARFPTEAVDFAQLPIGEHDASWWLDVRVDDLDASPLHSLRLYVNSESPLIERLLGGEESEVVAATRSVLFWDVARTLIDRALDDDRFVDLRVTFPVDSLGATLRSLLARFLPGVEPSELRRLRAVDPARYGLTLQARLGLLAST